MGQRLGKQGGRNMITGAEIKGTEFLIFGFTTVCKISECMRD